MPAKTDTAIRLGLCPVCTASHKLLGRGQLPRHAFSTQNVRHGGHSGFHIGGHGGDQPIGTAAGNAVALFQAEGHDRRAAELVGLPAVTVEDAERNALAGIQNNLLRGHHHGPAHKGPLPTLEEVRDGNKWLSYKGWFRPDALAGRVRSLQDQRARTIVDHREFAILLRDLVARHPAGEA
jgi:hypothetical protein